MTNLKLFATSVVCAIGMALTACGGGSSAGGGGSVQVEKPSITTQPAAQTITAGQTANFSVLATGTAPLGYQWQKNGTNITGATSSSYTTPATNSADNGAQYSVSVSNSLSTVTSNTATLTVSDTAMAPAITTQPADQSVTEGQTATFSVTATGSRLTYQWRKNGIDIPGATSSIYTTPAIVIGDNNAVFTVVVSKDASTVTSSTATLTVFTTRYAQVPKTGGFYDKTECVKDNFTGLIWEGKTASPATSRLGTSTYTNYDSTSSAQKWVGSVTFVNPTQAEIDASTNSIGYRNSVNASALCGYTDWRLPTKEELQGILAISGIPRIDTTWFPNTQASWYWSSSPFVRNDSWAWYVYFYDGVVYGYHRSYDGFLHVRLVR